MTFLEELKERPIAILGAGAVGKAVGADSVLAGNRVHLYELPEYAEVSLKNLEKTGIIIEVSRIISMVLSAEARLNLIWLQRTLERL